MFRGLAPVKAPNFERQGVLQTNKNTETVNIKVYSDIANERDSIFFDFLGISRKPYCRLERQD
jgi:hypothetical protein